MTELPSETAKWIEEAKLPFPKRNEKFRGITIGHCIPPVFEGYCKIFHPFESTQDLPDALEYREEKEQFRFISQDDLLQRRRKWLEGYNSKRWEFTKWKTIADRHGLIFHNEINEKTFVKIFKKIGWAKNLILPNEGHLPISLLIELLNLVKRHFNHQKFIIYQDAPHSVFNKPSGYDLVSCNYEEVLDYFANDFTGHLFGSDNSWIIYTDWDLTFTIVGGPKTFIDEITLSNLEALKCTSYTRVDYLSDKIN